MTKRKSILLGAILAVVLLLGAVSCSPADLKAFDGILQKLDSLSGNVTVTLSDNTTMTFNLNDVDWKALRKALGEADLEPGDNVTIRQGRNGEVKELKARYAVVQGTIKSLATENVTSTTANVTSTTANVTGVIGKITITAKQGDVTLLVTANTTIIRGWGTKKPVFSDLQVGQRVVAKYDAETLKALSITVNADGQIQDNKKFDDPKDKGNQNKNGQFNNQNREHENDD